MTFPTEYGGTFGNVSLSSMSGFYFASFYDYEFFRFYLENCCRKCAVYIVEIEFVGNVFLHCIFMLEVMVHDNL